MQSRRVGGAPRGREDSRARGCGSTGAAVRRSRPGGACLSRGRPRSAAPAEPREKAAFVAIASRPRRPLSESAPGVSPLSFRSRSEGRARPVRLRPPRRDQRLNGGLCGLRRSGVPGAERSLCAAVCTAPTLNRAVRAAPGSAPQPLLLGGGSAGRERHLAAARRHVRGSTASRHRAQHGARRCTPTEDREPGGTQSLTACPFLGENHSATALHLCSTGGSKTGFFFLRRSNTSVINSSSSILLGISGLRAVFKSFKPNKDIPAGQAGGNKHINVR